MTERKPRVSVWAAPLWALATLLAFMFHGTLAFAQASSGTGVLTGTVVDAADKKPASDVVVTATSPASPGEQVVVTDSSGYFRIPDLPSGVYSLRFEKDGYKPYSHDGIALRSDSTLRVNADLLPSTLKAEEVVVVARAPTVDVGSSSTGSNITADFTRRVPVSTPGGKGSANRSFESVAEVTPGAQADQYGVSIAGTSSPENGYMVDGLSVGNPSNGTIGTPLSSEFVKEVTVISGGYMPEYGRTMGGVLNAITKTGSNEFHGGVFSFYTPGGIAGTPRVVHQPIDTVIGTSPLSSIFDIGADIGGPIIKDKLWFYVGFDYSSETYDVNRSFWKQNYDPNANGGNGAFIIDPTTGLPTTSHIAGRDEHYLAQSQTIQAIGNLTYAVDANNKLSASFIAAPTQTGGYGKFSISPLSGGPETDATGFGGTYSSLAHQLSSASYDSSLKWSTEMDNKRVLVDTMVGWHHQYNDVLPADGTTPGSGGYSAYPNVSWNQTNPYHDLQEFEPGFTAACNATSANGKSTAKLCPLTTYTSGGPTGRIEQQTFDRYTAGSTLTYLFQGLGHHVAKVGFSVEYTTWDHLKAHAGGTSLIEGTSGGLADAEHFGVLLGPDNPSFLEPFHVKTTSVIGGGFLQDSWSVMDKFTVNAGLRYDVQSLYSASGQLGLTMPNEWSPRLGVIFDPTQEGRSKFFGNFARYYENVPLGIADASLSGEPSVLATYNGACNVAATKTSPYCQNNSFRVNGNPAFSPSQKWGTFGAGATPIDPNIQPTSSNELVFGGEYEIFKDSRLGLTYTHRWVDHWIEDMSHDDRQTFFIGNPGYGIASDFPKAQRDYDAATLYFMKTFGDDWLTSASYTVSYLRGNIGGLFNQNGELDPNHNADFDTKTIMTNSYGPLPGDHTHDIKIFGAKDWKLSTTNGLSTGLAFRAKSGGPIDFLGADSIYGSGIYELLPRGSGGRLPWVYDIDINLGYRLAIDKERTIGISMDIFNLFNFQEVTSVDENYTGSFVAPHQGGPLAATTVYPSNGPPRPINVYQDKNINFLSPTGFQTPRQFRFGLRGTF
jgi:outer membrane receptor protein involved in Fe transport